MSLWSWEFAWKIVPTLLAGLVVTVQATFFGIGLALVLGLVLAMLRRQRNPWVSWPAVFVIEFVRGTPLLVQLYFLFFVLPRFGINMDAFTTGAAGLGLHYATYTSEVYRSGIESVPVGQWEASTVLNVGSRLKWTNVILPQAIPTVIPALGNYLISMFKEAPLLSTITVVELLGEGRIICSRTFQCSEPYTLVGLMFLLISVPASILIRRLERRLVHSRI